MDEGTSESKVPVRICLVGEVMDDQETIKAAKHFEVPILTSETGQEYALEKDQWTTYFILKNFEGPLFDALSKSPNKCVYPHNPFLPVQLLIYCIFNFQGLGSARLAAFRQALGAPSHGHQSHLQFLHERGDHLFHGNPQKGGIGE